MSKNYAVPSKLSKTSKLVTLQEKCRAARKVKRMLRNYNNHINIALMFDTSKDKYIIIDNYDINRTEFENPNLVFIRFLDSNDFIRGLLIKKDYNSTITRFML